MRLMPKRPLLPALALSNTAMGFFNLLVRHRYWPGMANFAVAAFLMWAWVRWVND